MAVLFQIVTSYEDIEFVGGTTTRDVQVAGALSKPSGVYFEVRVPKTEYAKEGPSILNAAALGYADIFETLLKQPHVGGVLWGQESKNGQLLDVAIITVESASGRSSSLYTVPLVQLGPKLNAPQIAARSKLLDETEAL